MSRPVSELPDQPEPLAVLGIDEIHRGCPQRTWNGQRQCWEITVDRWHVGFVDQVAWRQADRQKQPSGWCSHLKGVFEYQPLAC